MLYIFCCSHIALCPTTLGRGMETFAQPCYLPPLAVALALLKSRTSSGNFPAPLQLAVSGMSHFRNLKLESLSATLQGLCLGTAPGLRTTGIPTLTKLVKTSTIITLIMIIIIIGGYSTHIMYTVPIIIIIIIKRRSGINPIPPTVIDRD